MTPAPGVNHAGMGAGIPQGKQAKATHLFFQIFFALHFCFYQLLPLSPSPTSQKKLNPSAPQVYIRTLHKAPPKPVQAVFHRYNHSAAQYQQFLFRLRILKTYRKCKNIVQTQRLICRFTTEKNKPCHKNIRILMVSNPKGKQPFKNPHDLKELRVSKNVRWQKIPKVCFFPYFTTATKRFSQNK